MAIGDIQGGPNLLKVTGQTGALTPNWYSVSPYRDRDQVSFLFSLKAGTATFVLEGRNSPDEPAVQLATGSATAQTLVPKMNHMRCKLTAATGAQVVGSVNAVLIDAGP